MKKEMRKKGREKENMNTDEYQPAAAGIFNLY